MTLVIPRDVRLYIVAKTTYSFYGRAAFDTYQQRPSDELVAPQLQMDWNNHKTVMYVDDSRPRPTRS